jgi:ribosome-associated protein
LLLLNWSLVIGHCSFIRGGLELDQLELARNIVELIADQKGEDILLLDIREVSILADYFVIGTTTSDRQADAIIDSVRQEMKREFDVRPLHIEGESADGWVLMDYGGVVVHLFASEMRTYYDLEGLWQAGRTVVRML